MTYSYKPFTRAFRSPKDEAQSPTISTTAVEHRFVAVGFNDGDCSSAASLVEDDLQVPRLPTKSMIALTCGIGGLRLIWSILFSHGSAYLFSLGITKSQSSLIWAIAPICSALIQPIIGAISDISQSCWGRRRPFILAGTIGIATSLTASAWVSDIMRAVAAIFGVHSYEGIKTTTQIGTIICITLLNLCIQPLQSGLRALVIDVCPSEQQSIASAWAGRFTGISNILGYILGSLPLVVSHGNEAWRFRLLSLLSVVVLVITVLTTIYFICEEDPRGVAYEPQKGHLLRALRNVKDGWSSMSTQARRVCTVQFFAWMGWFGFLFYSTLGIERFDFLRDASIRLDTFASLLSAIAALATTVISPHVASPNLVVSFSEKSIPSSRFGKWRTIFIFTTNTAILLIALTGVSWGITQWTPFALLGEEIAMHQAEKDSATEKGGQKWMSSPSGALMGVHNAAISIPQILAAHGSSFIFFMFEGNRSGEDDSIAWVLRTSGVAALVAAWLSWRLKLR
ncbi:MFS general substrate transporter [Lentithecium fluviatile CBS 122367]|uniref:MFS general substrate transporter n=1 Tax=Lentithecium fluviatile CBS 122367 TaxID=1168545 RepID=A0A6G1JNJ7_9PLEO|nr:MFS general substrate transporter [Lentithecium fluviatile CBS 122367]